MAQERQENTDHVCRKSAERLGDGPVLGLLKTSFKSASLCHPQSSMPREFNRNLCVCVVGFSRQKNKEKIPKEKRERQRQRKIFVKKKVGNENRFMSKLYVGVVIKMVTNL